MVHQAWSAGTLAIHGPTISGLHRISSLDPTLCWTRVEDIFIYLYLSQNIQYLASHFFKKIHDFFIETRKLNTVTSSNSISLLFEIPRKLLFGTCRFCIGVELCYQQF